MNSSIFIYGNVPSSKNNKRVIRSNKNGRIIVLNSTFATEYIKRTASQWDAYRNQFLGLIKYIPKPHHIRFQFVREGKQRFDFVNLCQLPLDLMVKNGWIEDDDYTNIVPVIDPEVIFDKNNAGLKITVL